MSLYAIVSLEQATRIQCIKLATDISEMPVEVGFGIYQIGVAHREEVEVFSIAWYNNSDEWNRKIIDLLGLIFGSFSLRFITQEDQLANLRWHLVKSGTSFVDPASFGYDDDDEDDDGFKW